MQRSMADADELDAGLRNAEIALSPAQILDNIRAVQRASNLPQSAALAQSKAAARPNTPNLDVEMETGTGKTYVYIKTMMELHKRYGWSKYIVVVPSIAIREGVKQSFDATAEHFQATYGTKPRAFIYNSANLHELESFSSESGVQVMIINVQAFNAANDAEEKAQSGKRSSDEARRIFRELDDFGSRRPIDVISANRPFVIIDEPQRLGTGASKSLVALAKFDPLAVLRYSATHREEHNKVHRLDAVDAYNQRLVKKIAVRGITVRGLAGADKYLYVEAIELAGGAKPRARVELEVQTKGGIKRQVRRLDQGSNLHDLSGGLEAYRGLFVTDIDATRDVVVLSDGSEIVAGQVTADLTLEHKRRIQIREVIRAHIAKERNLHARGIKVLSLCFIDEVSKYRDYDREDTLGEYARMFEEEYEAVVADELGRLDLDGVGASYRAYLERDPVRAIHQGYFSIDKKSDRFVDPKVAGRGEEKGEAVDADAYDLILRNKERLLSLDEPVRFLFSHSALREGWDNPNVFVMGMLKHSDNTVSRRQEIGRGLRLAVDQHGDRLDHPETVHQINELTVVTDESYSEFVAGLQSEISKALSNRPRQANEKYFTGKVVSGSDGAETIDAKLAREIYKYLLKNDYLNDDDTIAEAFKEARAADALAPAGEVLSPVLLGVVPLIEALYLDIPAPGDGRKPKSIPVNEANLQRREFNELWGRINQKAVYQVEFDSAELIAKSVIALDSHLRVTPLQYIVERGEQRASMDAEELRSGHSFTAERTQTHTETRVAPSQVPYDLLGEVADLTKLTRRTVAEILRGIAPSTFGGFQQNPEQFITDAARLINEQKAATIVEHIEYRALDDAYDKSIFTTNQSAQDFTNAGEPLKRHVYDYVVTDSAIERQFVNELETSSEVVVYAKLPRGFFIPTPVGDYNPDWAIAFEEGRVRHVYFVAETKGSLSTLQLRGVEEAKIACARKFFHTLAADQTDRPVRYDVVTDYGQLMALVGG